MASTQVEAEQHPAARRGHRGALHSCSHTCERSDVEMMRSNEALHRELARLLVCPSVYHPPSFASRKQIEHALRLVELSKQELARLKGRWQSLHSHSVHAQAPSGKASVREGRNEAIDASIPQLQANLEPLRVRSL